jgi:hypothetical protein
MLTLKKYIDIDLHHLHSFLRFILLKMQNNLVNIVIITLLFLLCIYITFLQGLDSPELVPIFDLKDSNIESSSVTYDQKIPYYSSIYSNGQFHGTFTSPWYKTDKNFVIDIGGWYGHTYFEGLKEDLEIFLETSDGIVYPSPVAGVSRLYYNKLFININPEQNALIFRIRTKGDSTNSHGWLSFSAPYYPKNKIQFSTFITKAINLILFICLIFSVFIFILNKGKQIKFLFIFLLLLCYFIPFYTPLGIVPYTPRSPEAQRIFITNDGAGYYAYLQELFFDDFSPEGTVSINLLENGKKFNIFEIGVALLELPFFMAAKTLSYISNLPHRNGVNELFQLFSAISSSFYFLLGIYFINKFMLKNVSDTNRVIILFSTIFGTNLFVYSTGSWGLNYSHIYGFAVVSILVYLINDYYLINNKSKLIKRSIIIGLLIGLNTSIRMHNCVIAIVFILYDLESMKLIFNRLKKYIFYYIIGFIFSLIAFVPQLLWWYKDTGEIFFDFFRAYEKIGLYFNWFQPEIINILFSVRKGLFFWTPLWILAYTTFLISSNLARKCRYAITIFLLVRLYIGSCYDWFRGGSFGQRIFADTSILFAIGLAVYLEYFKNQKISNCRSNKKYLIFVSIVFILVLYHIILTKAFIRGFIPFDMANIEHIYSAFTTIFM